MRTKVMSATHNRFGVAALNRRLTRSAGPLLGRISDRGEHGLAALHPAQSSLAHQPAGLLAAQPPALTLHGLLHLEHP
ncbi:hypothetical protein, partial [Mycobacterium ostraviense]|uniref:hypothetical protein n=1 Tax=Mycobacterium ostraviense TaxID=2738409 RepID=UPI001FCBB8CF